MQTTYTLAVVVVVGRAVAEELYRASIGLNRGDIGELPA